MDVLPAGLDVQVVGHALQLTAGPVGLRWQANPFRVEVTADATGLPAVDHVTATVTLSSNGLDDLSVVIGPAPVPAGPVELRPVLAVFAGAAPPGGRRVELGLDLDGTRRFAAQWLLDAASVQLVVIEGTAPPETDLAAVAAALAEVVATLAASIALAVEEVQHLLDGAVGATTVGQLLRGVVLEDDGSLDPAVFAPDGLLVRVVRLLDNLAAADLAVTVDGSLTVGIGRDGAGAVSLTLGLGQRVQLTSGDVTVWLEADDTWIEPRPPVAGVALGLVKLSGTTVTLSPSVTVSGLGIRIGRQSGPLLDLGLTLESIAVHGFAAVSGSDVSGGVQLQLSNLAVAVSGATGGNAIASGILADSASGGQQPKPAFSPSLAVQQHGTGPVEVTLRAGDGDGPWWIAIQKGFGPLYVEQVGFGVTMPQHQVESVSLLLDARCLAVRADSRGRRPVDHLLRGQGRRLQGRQLGRRPRRAGHRREHRSPRHQRRAAQERQRRQHRVPGHAARALRRLRPHHLRRLRQDRRWSCRSSPSAPSWARSAACPRSS